MQTPPLFFNRDLLHNVAMSKKIMLTGAGGMLAQDAVAILKPGFEVISRREQELDICDAEAVRAAVCSLMPDVVVNCAAYTQVDICETEQEKAFAVNAAGVKHLALACRQAGSLLVHISTDYVFDGTKQTPYLETDVPHPLSVYGRSKHAGENHVAELLEQYIIIRSSWLYGSSGNNFIATILRLAHKQKELQVVNDQRGSPTWTRDLSRAIKALIESNRRGIYHVSNQGSCTWYDYARAIVARAGLDVKVSPVTTAALKRPAPRPPNSVLDCSRFIRETGMPLRPWEDALEEYLQAELRQACS
jgi:dTDP-4-dehydrorhamnose reductase